MKCKQLPRWSLISFSQLIQSPLEQIITTPVGTLGYEAVLLPNAHVTASRKPLLMFVCWFVSLRGVVWHVCFFVVLVCCGLLLFAWFVGICFCLLVCCSVCHVCFCLSWHISTRFFERQWTLCHVVDVHYYGCECMHKKDSMWKRREEERG